MGSRTLTALNPAYRERVDSYWSASARLNPWCFVQPQTVSEVSLALTALVAAGQGAGDWHIAVRGGGHSGFPGVSNIDNGVTIDMGSFNRTSYNADTGLASVEPGGHWTGAYNELAKSNVTVVGGREGQVGIGGFLLGGGVRLPFFFDPSLPSILLLQNGEREWSNRLTIEFLLHIPSRFWV